MQIYILKQIIRKLINSGYYFIKKFFKNSKKILKIILTIILILLFIYSMGRI